MAARDFLYDERASRPALLTVVIGAHLAALFILWETEREFVRDRPGPSSAFLILDPPPKTPELLPVPERVALSNVRVSSPPAPSLAPLYLPSETTPIESAMGPPDWKQSGIDAAADAAQKNYRALGPRAAEPKIKAPRSPFKPPPKHKHGELGEDALENPVLWLSENCYIRFENRKLPLDDPFRSIPMTLCTFPVGKLEPKGDLFEHLRKPQPVP